MELLSRTDPTSSLEGMVWCHPWGPPDIAKRRRNPDTHSCV